MCMILSIELVIHIVKLNCSDIIDNIFLYNNYKTTVQKIFIFYPCKIYAQLHVKIFLAREDFRAFEGSRISRKLIINVSVHY